MKRLDALWAVAFVVLLLVGYGVVPTPEDVSRVDSFSEEASGKKAFYLVAEALLPAVARSSSSLIPNDDAADTLVMLGPARYPDRAQWQTLYDWISEGRALVFAARWQDPAVELEPFGIEIVPTETGFVTDVTDDAADVVTELVDVSDGTVDWRSRGEIVTDAGDATVELSNNGSSQVVWRPIGDGAIVVVASDYVFTNRALADDHGLLAFRILETAAPAGPVYFEETMNAAGAPRVVGVLFEAPFRLITIQLLIVAVLFGWMVSRRYGPIASHEDSARRSLVEHAEALGNLHFKNGSGGSLVASYLEFFRRELGLRFTGAGGALQRDPAVARSREEEIDRALAAARSETLPRERVAEAIGLLARLRDRRRF